MVAAFELHCNLPVYEREQLYIERYGSIRAYNIGRSIGSIRDNFRR